MTSWFSHPYTNTIMQYTCNVWIFCKVYLNIRFDPNVMYFIKKQKHILNNLGSGLWQYNSPSLSSISFPFSTPFFTAAICAKLPLAKSICFEWWSLFMIWNFCVASKYKVWYLYLSKSVCMLGSLSTWIFFGVPTYICVEQILIFGVWTAIFHLNLTKIGTSWNEIWWWQ